MMNTLFLSHPVCEEHDMGAHHPESPARLQSIHQMMRDSNWGDGLRQQSAPKLDTDSLLSIHPAQHVDAIMERSPEEGLVYLDADTAINPFSLDAALYAAGAGIHATEQVLAGQANNAFCAVRPPGHHAESAIAMGFCLFNSIAVAAERALSRGLSRVAILDFDVHHGNGTVEIFQDRPEVLVCSSFQYPFYPGRFDEVQLPNICLTPLRAGTGSDEFRLAIERDWLPAIQSHQPEMIFISAGFDAHADDPLGGLRLQDEDYLWITQWIREQADQFSEGRMVSMLEGGYDLEALARSVENHLRGLANLQV